MADIEKLNFPVIDRETQDDSAKKLIELDSDIELLKSEFQKYEWLKQAMMHDLLTGKVRLV